MSTNDAADGIEPAPEARDDVAQRKRLTDRSIALKVVLATQLFAAILLRSYEMASGWHADPAYLFGLLAPMVILPLFLHAALGPVTGIWLAMMRIPRQTVLSRLAAIFVASLAFIIAAPTPWMPSPLDVFQWRMRSIPEEEFHALAREVRREAEEAGVTDGHLDRRARARVLDALEEKYELLGISDFPTNINLYDGHVSIWWGSGLTGGYEVTIVDGAETPRRLPPPNIHATVAAYYRD
jgi:hypothetical protein